MLSYHDSRHCTVAVNSVFMTSKANGIDMVKLSDFRPSRPHTKFIADSHLNIYFLATRFKAVNIRTPDD